MTSVPHLALVALAAAVALIALGLAPIATAATWSSSVDQSQGDFCTNAGQGGGVDSGAKVHSAYADGLRVMEGAQPPRLPVGARGNPLPESEWAHTRLRWDNGNGRLYSATEFNDAGLPVRDIDFTSHPLSGHATPHVHGWYFANGNWARTGAFPV